MNGIRRAVPALLAAGLVAAVPAASVAAPAGGKAHTKAKASGSDAPPTLPSLVRVRIDRGTKALERAGDYVDQDMGDKAVASVLNARRNMYAAWRGAKYVVLNAPPPPVDDFRAPASVADAAVHHRKAHASQDEVVGTAYADPVTTAMAVLGYQHTVATSAYGLLDGAKGALRDSVSTTIFAALNRRDEAIQWIHVNAPAPPVDDFRVATRRARASQEDAAPDFGTLMPGVIPDLDDELQQVNGLLNGGALTPGEKHIMGQAGVQVSSTEQTINTYWPPVVGD
jgi:hypothetical protein